MGKYQYAHLRLGIVELHHVSYDPGPGIVVVLTFLNGTQSAWYFAGGLGTGLGIYETHSPGAFRKLSIVDEFVKLALPHWGQLATRCRAAAWC